MSTYPDQFKRYGNAAPQSNGNFSFAAALYDYPNDIPHSILYSSTPTKQQSEPAEQTSTQISVISVEVIKEISVEVPVEITKEISVEVPVEVIKKVEVTKEVSVEVTKEISVEVPKYVSVEVTSQVEQMKIDLLNSILNKMEYLSSSNFGMNEINRNLSSIIFQNDNPKPVPIYYA